VSDADDGVACIVDDQPLVLSGILEIVWIHEFSPLVERWGGHPSLNGVHNEPIRT
jgi:hypothetical protein